MIRSWYLGDTRLILVHVYCRVIIYATRTSFLAWFSPRCKPNDSGLRACAGGGVDVRVGKMITKLAQEVADNVVLPQYKYIEPSAAKVFPRPRPANHVTVCEG